MHKMRMCEAVVAWSRIAEWIIFHLLTSDLLLLFVICCIANSSKVLIHPFVRSFILFLIYVLFFSLEGCSYMMTFMKIWVMFVEKPWKIWRNWEKSLGPSKVIIVARSLDVVSIDIIDIVFGTGNWTRTLINSKPATKKQRNFSCVHTKPCLLNAALKRLVAEILFWSHFPNLSSLSLLKGVFGVVEIIVGSLLCWGVGIHLLYFVNWWLHAYATPEVTTIFPVYL